MSESAAYTGAHLVLDILADEGIEVVFGYPGGAIMPIYDALYEHRIQHILTRHEAGAAFAAGGYARSTGRVGVCMATSGPGATNLVTGILDAHMDSIPLVAITGQVRSTLMGTDGFQEADVSSIMGPVTKRSVCVRSIDDLERMVRGAFRVARGPRPGPVLVDIPNDILKARCARIDAFSSPAKRPSEERPSNEDLEATIELLRNAKRPVAIVGGGARSANATHVFRELCGLLGLPYTSTITDSAAPRRVIRITSACSECTAGKPRTSPSMKRTSCSHSACASTIASRAASTGSHRKPRSFTRISTRPNSARSCPSASRYAATCEPRSARSYSAWPAPACRTSPRGPGKRKPWAARCLPIARRTANSRRPIRSTRCSHPRRTMRSSRPTSANIRCGPRSASALRIRATSLPPPDSVRWASGCRPPSARKWAIATVRLSPWSATAAFKCRLTSSRRCSRYDLPVKILLIDNHRLGMVRQWQELFWDGRYAHTDLSDNPDFVAIARGYRISAERVEDAGELRDALERFYATKGPALLHCACFPAENVWPLIPPGATVLDAMEGKPEAIPA